MFGLGFTFAIILAIGLNFVVASPSPFDSNLQLRDAPRPTSSDSKLALRQALSSLSALKRDTVLKNSTSFDKSWDGAVLFHYNTKNQAGNTSISSSVDIVCTTCYIKGTATAQLTIDGNFNVTQAFYNITSEIESEFDNITTTTENYIKNYTSSVITSVEKNGLHLDDFDLPPIDVNFDIDLPTLPDTQLQFQFDGMELYVQIDTILSGSATYTLNLYTSDTPIGISASNDLLIGVVFSLDLILSVDGEIDISSGFHLLLNDGLAIEIPMFDKNVSSITFNGGHFEFLPVTIQSADVVLTALLRLGMKAGIDVSTSESIGDFDLDFSAGLEAGIWADLAQFTTNVTAASENSTCELRVVEEYTMLLGANAGATVAVEDLSWGPAASTQIPIFFTTLAEACAISGSATAAASSSPTVKARAGLTTSTISTEITYVATSCLSTGLLNCPVSLQTTARTTVTSTLVTAVSSGITPTFPATTQNSVANTVAFGINVQKLIATSGSPVSFVPTVSSTAGVSSFVDGKTSGLSNKVIIGASVGGALILIAIIAGSLRICIKRRRYVKVAPNYATQHSFRSEESYNSKSYMPSKNMSGKNMSTRVTVVELQRRS